MKPLLLAIFLGVLSAGTHAAEPLTAAELATHLGVFHWKSKLDLPPGSFAASIAEISDGKVVDTHVISLIEMTEAQEGQKVLVMASNDERESIITLAVGDSLTQLKCFRRKPFRGSYSLPDKITTGEFILGGDYITRNGQIVPTGKIADMKTGLLLRIVPNNVQPAK